MLSANLTQKEVDSPCNHWCASGHQAPMLFQEKLTRFFMVSTKDKIQGIFCEPCLIIAHWIAAQQKVRG